MIEIDTHETLDGSHIPWPVRGEVKYVDAFAGLDRLQQERVAEIEPVVEHHAELQRIETARQAVTKALQESN